jgi:uncharacterized cupin superfamily protein
MSDTTIKHFKDFESMSHEGMTMYMVRVGLGVSSFGISVTEIPPHSDAYPEHDHVADGIGGQMFAKRPHQLEQEEVYTVLEGSATLQAGGEEWQLGPGVFARVGPAEKRKIVPGDEGATVLTIGGTPGEPYELDGSR